MHQRIAFMFRIRISYTCRFNFEADIVLCTVFARCNTNDVTIPHVLCIEKKHCVLHHQFQRGVIWIQKTTPWWSRASDHTLWNNSIKTENIDGYIRNPSISHWKCNKTSWWWHFLHHAGMLTCSWTSSMSEASSLIKIGTAPASMTTLVCREVPDAMLVSAQAASN